ncbi:redox-sensitive transcriptional activator SoxR [Shimia sagamensis]|uniref:MerR family transcriptional regulator, redox-sensitive transcriptional activator SoxR n=1 Tax=Shimia sagamensis TaxID=1566352 RepID=A0ABY1NLF1_9RHOB|nr:redox-sensitive transcriptional activator SoxR [Shimia sagamensis]SMP12558.1 MerR family transcriptional regulator, redox-sensitive transcriptional activator SoxR [Shimia sagamensis]
MKTTPKLRLRPTGLTIGFISERTGLAPSAIRYYEEEGIVHPHRTDTGQRRFERADIRRLSFVMISQSLGFSIAEIRTALDSLPANRTPTKADWQAISESFRQKLDDRISQMTKLREQLDGCIGCGCLSLSNCKLYNPDDRARTRGTGPRYLMGDSPSDLGQDA